MNGIETLIHLFKYSANNFLEIFFKLKKGLFIYNFYLYTLILLKVMLKIVTLNKYLADFSVL